MALLPDPPCSRKRETDEHTADTFNVWAHTTLSFVYSKLVRYRLGDGIPSGPFLLERYEPNVKTVFRRHPDYFLKGLPWVDGVEWLVIDDPFTGLAMYRTGQLDCGPQPNWSVRQHDLESLKQSHPH
jgi:ABC-type oligopeptide transport system substrate-binding subunit